MSLPTTSPIEITVFPPSTFAILQNHQVLYSASGALLTLRGDVGATLDPPSSTSVGARGRVPGFGDAQFVSHGGQSGPVVRLRSSKGSGSLTHHCQALSSSSTVPRFTCGAGRGSGQGFAGGHLLAMNGGASQKGHLVVKMISNKRLKPTPAAVLFLMCRGRG